MNIQAGCVGDIPSGVFADLTMPYGNVICDIMEEDAVIDIILSEGGAAK